jgi:hypothetical protein
MRLRICLLRDKMNTLTTIVKVQEQLDYVGRIKNIDELIQHVQDGKNITKELNGHVKQVIKLFEKSVTELDFLDTTDISKSIPKLYTVFATLRKYHRIQTKLKWNIRKFYNTSAQSLAEFYTQQHELLEKLRRNTEQFQSDITNFGSELMENSETYTNYINHNQDELDKLDKTYHNLNEKLDVLHSGIQKRLPKARQRLIDFADSIVIYTDNYKQEISNSVSEFIAIIHSINDLLETEKQFKTHSLLKERSKESGSLFVFTSEEEYYKYMLKWNSEFGIEKLLGIVGNVTSFKYPTAYFDPNSGEALRSIVSGDPFYVIDDKTYPYIKMLEQVHDASHRKLLLYSKKKAQVEMVPGSIGITISWNNFPFSTHGQISKDLSLMASLLRPGGYALFNYADAYTVAGATFIEENKMPVIWRDRMERIAADNGLELVSRYDDKQHKYPFSICLFRKEGEIPELNLVNKVGLVLPDLNFLKKKG